MRKLKQINLYFVFIIVLLSSCVLIPRPDIAEKENILFLHLQSWNEFRANGIVEANYKSFVFRKNITLRKNDQALRIDIFDSGFMGLNPTPFFSMYMDSTLVIRPPFSKEIISARDAGIENLDSISFVFDLQDLLKYKKKIISQQYLEFPEFKIYFSDQMQINKIKFKDKPITITFSYLKGLEQISILNDNKKVANIQFDKILYQNVKIPALK